VAGPSRQIALPVATYLAVPAVLAASNLIETVPRRAAERSPRSRHSDRFRDDHVNGLAPPRRRRPRPILVPRPVNRGSGFAR